MSAPEQVQAMAPLRRQGWRESILEEMMTSPTTNVSRCANPQCEQEFKKLGEGKLYVRRAERGDKDLTQKALWLCPVCAELFDLRYDKRKQEYSLVRHRRVA
jgi:hypothetical protein